MRPRKAIFSRHSHSLSGTFTLPHILHSILKKPENFETYGPSMAQLYFRAIMTPNKNQLPDDLSKLIGQYMVAPLSIARDEHNEKDVHFFMENETVYSLFKSDESTEKFEPHPETVTQYPHHKIHKIKYTWIEQSLTRLFDSGITAINIVSKDYYCKRGRSGCCVDPVIWYQVGIVSAINRNIFDLLMNHANSDRCASLQASSAFLLKDKPAGGSGLTVDKSPLICTYDYGSGVSNIDGINYFIKKRCETKFNKKQCRRFTYEGESTAPQHIIISKKESTNVEYIIQLKTAKFEESVAIRKDEKCFIILGAFVCNCWCSNGTMFQINHHC